MGTVASAQSIIGPSPCTDLFISEIVVNKHYDASGNLVPDYAIEIYNPSTTNIMLSTYALEFQSSSGASLNVPLSAASIAGGQCLVVADLDASFSLSSLAQQLVPNLKLDTRLSVSLKKGTTILDQVGETLAGGSLAAFDPIAFAANPAKYLETIDLNLNEIEGIAIRRGVFVSAGISTFTTQSMLGKWTLAYGSDYSDLGTHKSNCWPSALGTELFVEWKLASKQYCMTDPPEGPISTSSNDDLAFIVSSNWPAGCPLTLTYAPNFVSNGSLGGAPNILFENSGFSANPNAALNFYPNVPTGSSVITPASVSQNPVVDQTSLPDIFGVTTFWMITAMPSTAMVAPAYFSYVYEFDLIGNVKLPALSAPCTGYSVSAGSNYLHLSRVEADGDGCAYGPYTGPYTLAVQPNEDQDKKVIVVVLNNNVQIKANALISKLEVINQLGQVAYQKNNCSSFTEVFTSQGLGKGLFYINLKTQFGSHVTKVFIP
jgi:hypothetical protein